MKFKNPSLLKKKQKAFHLYVKKKIKKPRKPNIKTRKSK